MPGARYRGIKVRGIKVPSANVCSDATDIACVTSALCMSVRFMPTFRAYVRAVVCCLSLYGAFCYVLFFMALQGGDVGGKLFGNLPPSPLGGARGGLGGVSDSSCTTERLMFGCSFLVFSLFKLFCSFTYLLRGTVMKRFRSRSRAAKWACRRYDCFANIGNDVVCYDSCGRMYVLQSDGRRWFWGSN